MEPHLFSYHGVKFENQFNLSISFNIFRILIISGLIDLSSSNTKINFDF